MVTRSKDRPTEPGATGKELAAADVNGELGAIIPAVVSLRIQLAGLDHAVLVAGRDPRPGRCKRINTSDGCGHVNGTPIASKESRSASESPDPALRQLTQFEYADDPCSDHGLSSGLAQAGLTPVQAKCGDADLSTSRSYCRCAVGSCSGGRGQRSVGSDGPVAQDCLA